jgi:hypothetical protein
VGGEQEWADGAHDHNAIWHAAAAVEEQQQVGSEGWWERCALRGRSTPTT